MKKKKKKKPKKYDLFSTKEKFICANVLLRNSAAYLGYMRLKNGT